MVMIDIVYVKHEACLFRVWVGVVVKSMLNLVDLLKELSIV